MASPLSQSSTKAIVDELDAALLWKDDVEVSEPYLNDWSQEVVTVGFGPGPHYEESIAEFTTQNDANAPLLAKAFCFLLNNREELLDAVIVREALATKYHDQKEQIIKEILDSQRDVLEKYL